MAGLYEDQISGAKQRLETARRLRESSFGQYPQGQFIGNYYAAPHWTNHLANALRQMQLTSQEQEAATEMRDMQRKQAQSEADVYGSLGMQAPKSVIERASTPAQEAGFIDKAVSFLRGEEAKGTPAQVYQPQVAQNLTPEQRQNALIQAYHVSPEVGKPLLDLEMEKQKVAERKAEKEAEREFMANKFESMYGVRPGERGAVVGGRIIQGDGQVQTLPRVGSGGGSTGGGGGSASGAAMSPNLWGRKPKSGEIKTGTDSNGNPALVDIVTGKIVPMSELGGFGKPKTAGEEKPLTEAQSNANTFASRMAEAEQDFANVEKQASPFGVNMVRGAKNIPLVKNIVNANVSGATQMSRQAQENWVTANLRKESGALIGKEEMDQNIEQYFPQPFDKPETIEQKRQNRILAQKKMMESVPESYRKIHSEAAVPKSESAPSTGGWSIREK